MPICSGCGRSRGTQRSRWSVLHACSGAGVTRSNPTAAESSPTDLAGETSLPSWVDKVCCVFPRSCATGGLPLVVPFWSHRLSNPASNGFNWLQRNPEIPKDPWVSAGQRGGGTILPRWGSRVRIPSSAPNLLVRGAIPSGFKGRNSGVVTRWSQGRRCFRVTTARAWQPRRRPPAGLAGHLRSRHDYLVALATVA
jgi:hypothetical protein